MYQVINLYQPVFRQQPTLLSAVTLLSVIAASIVLMSGVAVYAHSKTEGLQRTSKELALSHSQLSARIVTSTPNEAAPTDAYLRDEITKTQHKIDESRALLERIDKLFVGRVGGFSHVFEILAKTKVEGLWLTGIELDYDGNIEITGMAMEPKLVPKYLNLIAQHSPLEALNFGAVNLTRKETNHSEITFSLSYSVQGGDQ